MVSLWPCSPNNTITFTVLSRDRPIHLFSRLIGSDSWLVDQLVIGKIHTDSCSGLRPLLELCGSSGAAQKGPLSPYSTRAASRGGITDVYFDMWGCALLRFICAFKTPRNGMNCHIITKLLICWLDAVLARKNSSLCLPSRMSGR